MWLLAVVPNRGQRASKNLDTAVLRGQKGSAISDHFGDNISKKYNNTLCIGYLNIGGLNATSHSYKGNRLQKGITAFDFDIFWLRETNLDWRSIPAQDKLYTRTKEWWEAAHISYGHNRMQPPTTRQQWRGRALLSINKATHQVISKGVAPWPLEGGARLDTRGGTVTH